MRTLAKTLAVIIAMSGLATAQENATKPGIVDTTDESAYAKLKGNRAGEEREFELAPGVKMTFCWCPPGEFMMGSNSSRGDLKVDGFVLSDKFVNSDEQPAHRVRITKPFYMGIHEVTRGQFAAFVTDTGYQTDAEKDGKGG